MNKDNKKCHTSDGFLPIYDKGLIAGKREEIGSKVYFSMNI